MKIALLAESIYQAVGLNGIQNFLLSNGHIATIFYQDNYQEETGSSYINWKGWYFGDLLSYDTLVVFNGWGPDTIAQTLYLQRAFSKKKFFYVETGWFPQREHIYIDPCGAGGRSSLSQRDLSLGCNDDCFEELTSRYTKIDSVPYYNYILVPLQREEDTSIIYDSHIFKTMYSLLRYIKINFSEFTIVASVHPLWPYKGPEIPGVIFEDKIPTIQLAQHARAIVGINSTSMFESLQFYTPTMMFGRSILSSTSGITATADLLNPRTVSEFTPDKKAVRYALSSLFNIQFKAQAPVEKNILPLI
jgi:hypothetical protein